MSTSTLKKFFPTQSIFFQYIGFIVDHFSWRTSFGRDISTSIMSSQTIIYTGRKADVETGVKLGLQNINVKHIGIVRFMFGISNADFKELPRKVR